MMAKTVHYYSGFRVDDTILKRWCIWTPTKKRLYKTSWGASAIYSGTTVNDPGLHSASL